MNIVKNKVVILIIAMVCFITQQGCENGSTESQKTDTVQTSAQTGTIAGKTSESSLESNNSGEKDKASKLLPGVSHFQNATVKIKGDKTVYFDPISIIGEPHDADIVFITHTHNDHFLTYDIKKVMKDGATLVITSDGVQMAQNAEIKKIVDVSPNKEYEVDGIKFKTVPSYNLDGVFHPKESNWVGYVINMNSTSYYIAGDTDVIPEMSAVKADVAFLPVGGTYLMDPSQAAQAAKILKPKFTVPIHYDSREYAENFLKLLDKSIKGIIIES